MFTVAINAIHLQNLIHLHKSCTNMDIKICIHHIIGSNIHEDFFASTKENTAT